MEAAAGVTNRLQPLVPSLHVHCFSFSTPISSLPFRNPPSLAFSPSLKFSSLSVKSSSSPSFPDSIVRNPKSEPFQISDGFPFSFLKTTLVAAITATAFFFARFYVQPLHATAVTAQPAAETASYDEVSDEERERVLEESLQSQPDDVQTLRDLMEIKIKDRKVHEAIDIMERLIELEPNDVEWPLLKCHMYCYGGQLESAKVGFNEILEKDPLRVEAYHGLVMVASQENSISELEEIEKRIVDATKKCENDKNKADLRDFKLLQAQIRVIEGDYNEALKIYQALVKEEPRDFRPYLCQGIIYTLLKKKAEADKNFEKYRRLVPEGHPYARYFDDNMIATKLFAQKVENEKAKTGSKSRGLRD